MIEQGFDVDNLARRVTLQRQMSDALHDFAELESLRRLKQTQVRSWNERDEFYGPNHPLKTKYREMNSDATKLFLKMRQDSHFFDQYSRKEVVCERD